jgi:hypothetical protein
MRLLRVFIVTIFTVVLATRAEAVPTLVTFDGTIGHPNATLNGLHVFGSFLYDDPYGLGRCTDFRTIDYCFGGVTSQLVVRPMIAVSLNIGPYQFNSSHTTQAVVWALPYIVWGPQVTFAPQFLPPQVAAMSLHADSNVILSLQGADGTQSLNWPAFTAVEVPEPSALLLSVGAVTYFIAKSRRKKSAR